LQLHTQGTAWLTRCGGFQIKPAKAEYAIYGDAAYNLKTCIVGIGNNLKNLNQKSGISLQFEFKCEICFVNSLKMRIIRYAAGFILRRYLISPQLTTSTR
jgi:hypothetical protein